MATIPRTYLLTDKANLPNIDWKNGQIIAVYDSDEVWYDAPDNGTPNGNAVRRKISGVKVVTTLPDPNNQSPTQRPMEDIVYVYIGDHGTLVESDQKLYDLRVWVNGGWLIVGTNRDDVNVQSTVAVSGDRFYLVGSTDSNESVGSLVKGAVYIKDNVIYGDLNGHVTNAQHADSADIATKATYDYDPENPDAPLNLKKIVSYLHSASSDYSALTDDPGSIITFTLGDGTTSTIQVADTQYEVFTQDANVPGLVNGVATTVNSDSTNLLLTGSGWMNKNNITVGAAEKANKDNYGSGQVIASTYIKGIAYDASTEIMTVTKGDGTDSTISIPDTTYGVYSTGTDGLVPGPTANDSGKVLTADGYWTTLPVYTTPNTSNPGLVPVAGSGKDAYYLKGNGTWGTTFTLGTDGLVPGPAAGITSEYSLRADGTWAICPDTKNTTGATNVSGTQSQSPLFLVGATNQESNPQTYSDIYVYVENHKLYQYDADASTPGSVQVVDVSSVQSLTNKTYEGYTLGNACEATVSSAVNADSTLPTGNAVTTYVGNQLQELAFKLDSTVVAPLYDTTIGYSIGDYRMYADNNGTKLYKCINPITSPAGDFNPSDWQEKTLIDVILGN